MPDGHVTHLHPTKARQPRTRTKRRTPPLYKAINLGARVLSRVAPPLAARVLERMFFTPQRNPMPEREIHWMKGAKTWRIQFDEKRSLPLYAWGDGPTVLLVHGFSGRGSQMGAFIVPLLAAGYRVVIFDAPAHGGADGKQTALPEVAMAVLKVAEHLGPLAGCIAHSIGTAATTIALSKGLDCDRVVYIAPPEYMGVYLLKAAKMIGFSEAVAGRVRASIEARYGMAFEAIRGTNLAPGQKIPALLVHDRRDTMVSIDDSRKLVSHWPGARLVETEGLGHSRILRDAKVVAGAVGFLSGLS